MMLCVWTREVDYSSGRPVVMPEDQSYMTEDDLHRLEWEASRSDSLAITSVMDAQRCGCEFCQDRDPERE